ncbi:MAG: hypothetical protein RLZZ299_1652 [Pseudomonadota bacterium]
MSTPTPPSELVRRFRGWVGWGIAAASLLYVGGTVLAGFREVGTALVGFAWPLYVPVLLLTLVNYGARFWKWDYLLRRVGVVLPARDNLVIFVAGLAMVLSPGKAAEVLKPWLVRARTGAPLTRTVPVLVAERLTDGIAVLALAAVSVGRYAGDRAVYVWGPIALVAVGLAVLAHDGLSRGAVAVLARIPWVGRIAPRVAEMLASMRVCLAPGPLLLTLAVSAVAWWAECVGYWLVFRGFDAAVSLELSTFLYAFATVAGGAMPGGLGMADGALAGGAVQLAGVPEGVAVAAALLVRVATLWFGVVLGGLVMPRVARLVEEAPAEPTAPDAGPSATG